MWESERIGAGVDSTRRGRFHPVVKPSEAFDGILLVC